MKKETPRRRQESSGRPASLYRATPVSTTLHRCVVALSFLAILSGSASSYGQDWQQVAVGSTEDLNSVWFTDSVTGWVAGNGGTVRVTADGGGTWQSLVLTNDDLLDVTFRGDSLGLIMGDNGRVFRTVNGGISWTPVPAVTGVNLAGVAFGGAGTAYAAGRDGTILRSLDDGATWGVVETGSIRYRRVAARGNNAWVVGEGGVIRSTHDGGETWSTQISGTSNDLKDVSFIDSLQGWAGGQNDTLLHTLDGGTTWTSRNTGINVGIDIVFFGNANLGWAIGDDGSVFVTVDGGQSWQVDPTGTAAGMNALHFSDAFHGWTAGPTGMLMARREEPVQVSATGSTLTWPTVSGATAYDVVVGNLQALRSAGGNVGQALDRCLAAGQADPSIDLAGTQVPAESAWFLVRPRLDGNGSYNSGSFSQQSDRDGTIAATGIDCF